MIIIRKHSSSKILRSSSSSFRCALCRVVADRLAALSRELEDGGEIDAEMLEDEEERMELSTYARRF